MSDSQQEAREGMGPHTLHQEGCGVLFWPGKPHMHGRIQNDGDLGVRLFWSENPQIVHALELLSKALGNATPFTLRCNMFNAFQLTHYAISFPTQPDPRSAIRAGLEAIGLCFDADSTHGRINREAALPMVEALAHAYEVVGGSIYPRVDPSPLAYNPAVLAPVMAMAGYKADPHLPGAYITTGGFIVQPNVRDYDRMPLVAADATTHAAGNENNG